MYYLYRFHKMKKSCVHISGEERIRLLNYQNNFISRIECLSNFKNLIFLDFFNNNIEVTIE